MAAYERGDYATAMRGFRILVEQGDANAQFNLGSMYDFGEGVPECKRVEPRYRASTIDARPHASPQGP